MSDQPEPSADEFARAVGFLLGRKALPNWLYEYGIENTLALFASDDDIAYQFAHRVQAWIAGQGLVEEFMIAMDCRPARPMSWALYGHVPLWGKQDVAKSWTASPARVVCAAAKCLEEK